MKRFSRWFCRGEPPRQMVRRLYPLVDGNEAWGNIPRGIVRRIGAYLCPSDRAAFSLASRWLRVAVGVTALRVHGIDRFQLLLYLERDGCFPDDILCSLCHKFHPPRLTLEWDPAIIGRACVNYGNKQLVRLMTSPHLPPMVHFDLIAAETRKQRHMQKRYGLMSVYSAQNLFTCHSYCDSLGQDRIWSYLTCRVVDGHFIMKTELVLLAAEEPGEVLAGVPSLLRMLLRRPSLGQCCEHLHWTAYCDYIFDPANAVRTGKAIPKDLHTCLWTHDKCKGYKTEDGRWVTKCGDRVSKVVGDVMGCMYCATDLTISVKRTSDGVNMLVLTTWKDLGEGINVRDPCWTSHLLCQGGITRGRPHDCGIATIYRKFEKKGTKYYPNHKVWQQCHEKIQRDRESEMPARPPQIPDTRYHATEFQKPMTFGSRSHGSAAWSSQSQNGSSSYGNGGTITTNSSRHSLDTRGSPDSVRGDDFFHVSDGSDGSWI